MGEKKPVSGFFLSIVPQTPMTPAGIFHIKLIIYNVLRRIKDIAIVVLT